MKKLNIVVITILFKLSILCQKILRVVLFISIIILTKINLISYTIYNSKPKLFIWKCNNINFDIDIKKSNKIKIKSCNKSNINEKNNKNDK